MTKAAKCDCKFLQLSSSDQVYQIFLHSTLIMVQQMKSEVFQNILAATNLVGLVGLKRNYVCWIVNLLCFIAEFGCFEGKM